MDVDRLSGVQGRFPEMVVAVFGLGDEVVWLVADGGFGLAVEDTRISTRTVMGLDRDLMR